MSPLRPRVALLLVLAALPAAAEPVESGRVSAAKALVEACVKARVPGDACRDARAVLSGYLMELKDAEACLAKRCDARTVSEIFTRVRKLDEAEHALPDAARSDGTGRPFLRLSLLVDLRASRALAAMDPAAKPPPRYDPPVDAPRAVEAACLSTPASCAPARQALARAAELERKVAACSDKPCEYDELDADAVLAADAYDSYEQAGSSGAGLLPVFSLIADASERVSLVMFRDLIARLSRLDQGVAALESKVAAFEKNPSRTGGSRLEAEVGDLSDLYREASLGKDRVSALTYDDDKTAPQRARLNAAAARLAAARARLLASETAHGLDDGRGDDGAVLAGAAGARPAFADRKLGLTLTPRLDRRTIPPPAPKDAHAPPILAADPGLLQTMKNLRSDDPTARADARRRMGLTRTLGDPAGRAALVHSQRFPDTCALVSQQEVLAELHLLPVDDPVKAEELLREEALSRGFYRHGTPTRYSADLIVDRGVLVAKATGAPLRTLDAAVRRGGMVIASVDARYIWDQKSPTPLGHAVVITGAEIDRLSGRTLGYYINDSGTDPPGRGRFIPIETFAKAWEHQTRAYAEVR